jgi:DNA-binding transcriptional regulator YiaG
MLVVLEVENPDVLKYQLRLIGFLDQTTIKEEVLYHTALRSELTEGAAAEEQVTTCLIQIQSELDKLDRVAPAVRSMRIIHSRATRKKDAADVTTQMTPASDSINPKAKSTLTSDTKNVRCRVRGPISRGVKRTLDNPANADMMKLMDTSLLLAEEVISSLKKQEVEEVRKKEKSTKGALAALFEDEEKQLRAWRESRKLEATRETLEVLARLGNSLKSKPSGYTHFQHWH